MRTPIQVVGWLLTFLSMIGQASSASWPELPCPVCQPGNLISNSFILLTDVFLDVLEREPAQISNKTEECTHQLMNIHPITKPKCKSFAAASKQWECNQVRLPNAQEGHYCIDPHRNKQGCASCLAAFEETMCSSCSYCQGRGFKLRCPDSPSGQFLEGNWIDVTRNALVKETEDSFHPADLVFSEDEPWEGSSFDEKILGILENEKREKERHDDQHAKQDSDSTTSSSQDIVTSIETPRGQWHHHHTAGEEHEWHQISNENEKEDLIAFLRSSQKEDAEASQDDILGFAEKMSAIFGGVLTAIVVLLLIGCTALRQRRASTAGSKYTAVPSDEWGDSETQGEEQQQQEQAKDDEN